MSYPRAAFGVLEDNDEYILLVDYCEAEGTMSITNDAENVVDHMLRLVGPKKIYYVDTDGRVDELEHNTKEFIGFKPGYDNLGLFKAEKKDE